MKKIILLLAVSITSKYVQSQSSKTIAGSWININVVNYFKSDKDCLCVLKDFDNDKFIPLYLSFNNIGQVKITFKVEQEIFTYKVNYLKSDSINIIKGNNSYFIYLKNGKLKLKFGDRLATFEKVSDGFAKDVFSEFIKSIIFNKSKNYKIISFRRTDSNFIGTLLNRNNFIEQLKKIFKGKEVEVVQLGTFKFAKLCFPEIAVYPFQKKTSDIPQVLGIINRGGMIDFVEKSGAIVLSLMPSQLSVE